MLKIEQLFYAIQVRNHISLLSNSNILPNLTKEKLREIKDFVRKVDHLVLDSSLSALKETEDFILLQNSFSKKEEPVSDIVSEMIDVLPKSLHSQIGEQKISIPIVSEQELWNEVKDIKIKKQEEKEQIENLNSEEKGKKRGPKPKVKEDILDAKLEISSLAKASEPETLSEIQKSNKRGIFRRKS